jgi:hypothetical protein
MRTRSRFEAIHRYFRTLGLLAKNDIFYQFEPTIVIGFISAFRDAMRAGGDWDVRQEVVAAAATAFLRRSRCWRTALDSRSKLAFQLEIRDLTAARQQGPPLPAPSF